MELEPIDEVRRASDLTMDCVTAGVAWSAQVSFRSRWAIADISHPDHFGSGFGRTARAVRLGVGSVGRAFDRGSSKLTSADSHGVVDFQTGACLLTGRKLGLALDLCFRPGSSTLRRHRGGNWHEMRERSAQGSVVYSPVWLVELLRGATEATLSEHEAVDGTLCRRLTARCDPSVAAQRSRHGMKLFDFDSRESDTPDRFEDQRSVPTDLWIDSSGCLRRIRTGFQMGQPDGLVKPTYGLVAELSLRDLGTAAAPMPPSTAAVAAKCGT
jgi:hypothetical protein